MFHWIVIDSVGIDHDPLISPPSPTHCSVVSSQVLMRVECEDIQHAPRQRTYRYRNLDVDLSMALNVLHLIDAEAWECVYYAMVPVPDEILSRVMNHLTLDVATIDKASSIQLPLNAVDHYSTSTSFMTECDMDDLVRVLVCYVLRLPEQGHFMIYVHSDDKPPIDRPLDVCIRQRDVAPAEQEHVETCTHTEIYMYTMAGSLVCNTFLDKTYAYNQNPPIDRVIQRCVYTWDTSNVMGVISMDLDR